jgi:hypothetical protein
MFVDATNLAQVLQQLSRLGKPMVGIYGSCGPRGWHAALELPAPAGCKAQVASTFTHPNPESAVQQLVDRLEALRGASLGDQVTQLKRVA